MCKIFCLYNNCVILDSVVVLDSKIQVLPNNITWCVLYVFMMYILVGCLILKSMHYQQFIYA